MRIDGEDIAVYGAKQWNVEINYSELSNQCEWLSDTPLMLPGESGFKTIKVSVILEGAGREALWKNGQRIVAKLLKPCTVELDGFKNLFYVALKNAQQAEKDMQRWHKATFDLLGYEYGKEITVSTSARTLAVDNPGNLDTPAIIEMIPDIGRTSIVLNGACWNRYTGKDNPITVNRLFKDQKIIINGETGLITEAGANKIQDVELLGLPALRPGRNQISVSQDLSSFTVKFKPRYL